MKKLAFLSLGVALSAAFFLGYQFINETSSAQKIARNQWEYSAIVSAYSFNPARDKVNKIFGMAEICYLQITGCRRAEVKYELDYGTYLAERGLQENFESRKAVSLKASEAAFRKALAQLGNEGWEIIGEPNLQYEFVNIDEYNTFDDKSILFDRSNSKAVYLKRIKTQ